MEEVSPNNLGNEIAQRLSELSISKPELESIEYDPVEKHNRVGRMIKSLIEDCYLITTTCEETLNLLCDSANIFSREMGDYIVREGDECQNIYIVKMGELAFEVKNPETGEYKDNFVYKDGDVFGERELILGKKFQGNIRAKESTVLYAIPKEVCKGAILDKSVAKLLVTQSLLKSFSLMSHLDGTRLFVLMNKITMETFEEGQTIIEQVIFIFFNDFLGS